VTRAIATRQRFRGWEIAAALLWLLGPVQPVAAQTANAIGSLETELAFVNARIAEADRLLQELIWGRYLVPRGIGLAVMTRDQLVEFATEQLYRSGTGIGGAETGQEEALNWVRTAVAGNAVRAAALRQARQDDLSRQVEIRRELDQRRRFAPSATSRCGFPYRWRIDISRRGTTDVAVDAAGNVAGVFNTTGRARLVLNQLTINWVSRSGRYEVAGRYIVTLDAACNGAGELVLDIVPAGVPPELDIQGGPVTFTSLGAGSP